MATVKKITPSELKKIIYEEKLKLGLITKKKLNESDIIRRQIKALQYLKSQAGKTKTRAKSKFISEARKAIKLELLRGL